MSQISTCPHCGQTHREGARFCPTTGRALGPEAAAPVVPEMPTGQTGKLPPSTLLNKRYEIIDKIGQGGMAAVYKASDSWQPGALWAVKEMSDTALVDPEERTYAVQSFQQEANLLRTLSHPNLPKVVDFFTEGSKHYLVMEYVPGQSLAALLSERQDPFPEAQVLSWALQLCDVLAYLHSQSPQIIFRDLKPSNIMLTPGSQIKLIDFGIVRFFKPGKAKDTLALGTPGFIAPEAVSGQTDERSDIYSLCVTLHQLLTRHNPTETMFQMPPTRSINPAVSVEMDQILSRGTDAQRTRRWTNAPELRTALQTAFSGQVPVGDPISGAPVDLIAPAGGIAGRRISGTSLSGDNAGAESPQTSRPTARLIFAATQLSMRQLAALGVILIAVLVGATWALAPILDNVNIEWNTVPLMALFGAFGFAAYPKRGSVFISHVLLTTALVATIFARLGTQGYTWEEYALAVLTSGAVMEIWAAFLPYVKGQAGNETWVRELIWLAIMEIIGMILFFGLLRGWETALTPLMWGFSALFAGIGWFVGDLIQQYFLYRKTGIRR